MKSKKRAAYAPRPSSKARRAAAGAIELPGELVLRQSNVIERVLDEAIDILNLRVVQIRVRETSA
jgi:hypothetical protein